MQAAGYAPPIPSSGAAAWLAPAHKLLLGAFLFQTFIGTHPLADGAAASRVDGNLADRFVVLSMTALALIILAAKWRETLVCVRRNIGALAIVGFCLASILWSAHPDLTLRRGLLFVFLTIIAMGVAVSITDLRRFHTFFFVFLSVVILLNLASVLLAPSIAISSIGVKGLYTQKNVAGIVGLMTLLVGATWIAGAERGQRTWLAWLALVPATLFLVITRSKTSINVAAIGLGLIVLFALAERYGERFILFLGVLFFLFASVTLVALAAVDFDPNALLASIVGDTTFTGREELWAFVRRAAEKRPWLGYGYGAYWDVGVAHDPLLRAEAGSWLASVDFGTINQAHHGYLELWLHIGWPATALVTFIILKSALFGGARAILGLGPRAARALYGGLAVLLLMHLMHNFTEATLFMRGSIFSNIAMLAMFVLSSARDVSPITAHNRPA